MLWGVAKVLFRALLIVVVIVVLLGGAGAVRLTQGPISLAIVGPYIADSLNDADGQYRFTFKDVVLAWAGWDQRVSVALVDGALMTRDGAVLVRAPRIAVGFHLPALAAGRIEPNSLELIAPRVHLLRHADGTVDFGVGEVDGEPADQQGELFAQVLRGEGPPVIRELSRVGIVDARVQVSDEISGAAWRVDDLDLWLFRVDGGIAVDGAARAQFAGRPASATFSTRYAYGDQPTNIAVTITDLVPAGLAEIADPPLRDSLSGMAVPVSGRADVTLDDAGALAGFSFDLSVAPGQVTVPDSGLPPLHLKSARMKGEVSGDVSQITLQEVSVQTDDGLQLSLQGTIANPRSELAADIEGRFDGLAFERLAHYWPAGAVDGAREWVTQRVVAGAARDGVFSLHLKPGDLARDALPADAAQMSFRFDAVGANVWDPLPAITGAGGTLRINASELELVLETAQAGALALSEGRVVIAGLSDPGIVHAADITFVARASTRDALLVLNRPPLGLISDLGLDPDSVDGQSAIRASFVIPLLKELSLDEIRYEASANLVGFAVPKIFDLFALSDGEVSLSVKPDGLDASGYIALNGVPARFGWRSDFDETASLYPSRYRFEATLDDAGRDALKLSLAPYLTGSTPLSVALNVTRDGAVDMSGSADLKDAVLTIAELPWSKPAGDPGTLAFQAAVAVDGSIGVRRFDIKTGGDAIVGAATLEASGRLRQLTLETVRAGANDFSGTVTFPTDGAPTARIQGKSLDLRAHLDIAGDVTAPAGRATKSAETDIALSLAVANLIVREDIVLSDAKARAVRRDGAWTGIQADGALNGGPAITVAGASKDGDLRLTLQSADAGTVARVLGWFDELHGGALLVTASVPEEGDDWAITGDIQIDGFRIARASILTRILTLGSLTGVRDLLSGDGISFRRLNAPFTLTAEAFAVRDGRAAGPALGLTFAGALDLIGDGLKVKGTAVPAYSFNRVLGAIPLLGSVLVGTEGGGVFAIDYEVAGTQSEPKVSVNALSSLTPAFLRNIISVMESKSDKDNGAPLPGSDQK